MLALILLVAVAPSPSPSPLKTITHVRAGPVCTALHDLVLPAARITKATQPLFHALEGNIAAIHSVLRELGPGAGTGGDGAGKIFLDRLTALPIANSEWTATQILARLYEIDKILAASYAEFPQGTNRNLDALRQRIQNLVDLQRAYANALRAGPAMILDNKMMNVSDPTKPANFGGGPTADPSLADNPGMQMVQAQALARASSPEDDPRVGGDGPVRHFVAKDLRSVPASALGRSLVLEEKDLVAPALAAIRDCEPAI